MTIPEIKIPPTLEDLEASTIKLFDIAMVQAMQQLATHPDMGFTAEATVGEVSVELSLAPPPRVSGGGGGNSWKGKEGGASSAPAKFDKSGVDAVLMANQDQLRYEEKDGKVTISPKSFLGDLWAGINDDLKKYGMKWVSAGKASHWEAQP